MKPRELFLLTLSLGILLVLAGFFGYRMYNQARDTQQEIDAINSSSSLSAMTSWSSEMSSSADASPFDSQNSSMEASDASSSSETSSFSAVVLPNTISYQNTTYKYGFALPKNVYYSGFGGTSGALHTVGIKKSGVPDTLADADVQVYYYGSKQPATGFHNNFFQDPDTQMTYLKILDDAQEVHYFGIHGDFENPAVNTIIQTVHLGLTESSSSEASQ